MELIFLTTLISALNADKRKINRKTLKIPIPAASRRGITEFFPFGSGFARAWNPVASYWVFCFANKEVEKLKSPPEQWETCEIVWDLINKGEQRWLSADPSTIVFWAKAINTEGSYTAATSKEFTSSWPEPTRLGVEGKNRLAQLEIEKKYFESLLAKLIKDEWIIIQYPEKGVYNWWTYKLQRRVRFE